MTDLFTHPRQWMLRNFLIYTGTALGAGALFVLGSWIYVLATQ